MKLAIIAITDRGRSLAEKLVHSLDGVTLLSKEKKVSTAVADSWKHFDGFIFIMAAGIVVRTIAPLVQNKHHDPCVVVMDEKGRHVISLLSGHIGGGNQLAHQLASLTGGEAVITTASDTLGLTPLDLWARQQDLYVEDQEKLTGASSKFVNCGILHLYTDLEVDNLPTGLTQTEKWEKADIIVSNKNIYHGGATLFRPRNLIVGIGCNRGTPEIEFEESLNELLYACQLSRSSIRNLASIDKKKDEAGLLKFSRTNHWHIDFFDRNSINELKNLEISFAALKAVGAIGVAEPTALLSSRSYLLLSRKRKWKNITMAIAQAPFTLSAQVQDQVDI